MSEAKTCPTCRFLVDDERPGYKDTYVRCAWFDDRPLPMAGGWLLRATASAWITRKIAITERGARLAQCDVHEVKP